MPISGRSISLILVIVVSIVADESEQISRVKRNYYGGYDMYGSDDFWYVGRIIGMIVGICILLFCCCLPCVCVAGIWFAGWFGLRSRQQGKKSPGQASSSSSSRVQIPQSTIVDATPGNANYSYPAQTVQYAPNVATTSRQYPVRVESSPRDSETSQIIYSAEDRYYTSSTAPAPAHRPNDGGGGAFNSTRY